MAAHKGHEAVSVSLPTLDGKGDGRARRRASSPNGPVAKKARARAGTSKAKPKAKRPSKRS